jgi:hypothetical protein
MNIFYLDEDTKINARYHLDKHVVKMILETAQLLCGVHWCTGNTAPYKMTHKNHPCSIWVRQSIQNYKYLCNLGKELCKEYTHRYGKVHKTENIIDWCIEHKPNIPDAGFSYPPKAMPDEYKVDSVVESYRNYYMGSKSEFATWKNRETPKWFKK